MSKKDLMTYKCLNKLNNEELIETVHDIKTGLVDYNVEDWEDVYPTNQDILNFARDNFGIE